MNKVTNEIYLLRFSTAGRAFALPVSEVERVTTIQSSALYPLPFGVGQRILGLFRCQGAVYPLLDVGGRLDDEITVLLVLWESGSFGIPVDSVRALMGDDDGGDVVVVHARQINSGEIFDL